MLQKPLDDTFYFSKIRNWCLEIPENLKEEANLRDKIEVIGMNDHLEIWNKKIVEELTEKPLTYDELNKIAKLFYKI